MHSEKMAYKDEIYKPLLELGLMKDYFLILPLSKRYESTYMKELMLDSDIIICDLSKFNFFANIELKTARKLNKNIYYFINELDKNVNKYTDLKLIKYNDSNDFSGKVKLLLDSLNKKELLLKRDNIYRLGKIKK